MCGDSPEDLGYDLGKTKDPIVSPHIVGAGPATVPIVSVHTVGSGLAMVDFDSTCTRWHHGGHSSWALHLGWTGSGQEYGAVHFTVGAHWPRSLYTIAWCQIWS